MTDPLRFQIHASHFTAGLTVSAGRVVEAAPILRRFRGLYWGPLRRDLEARGWRCLRASPWSRTYAGIGSREAPMGALCWAEAVAGLLAQRGYTLRTGGARGMDSAFQQGAEAAGGQVEVWRPGAATEEAYDLAAEFHPAWSQCSTVTQALHARNGHILLGAGLDDPVDFVLCWTPGGAIVGGTGQGLRIAAAWGIDVVNAGAGKPGARIDALLAAAE